MKKELVMDLLSNAINNCSSELEDIKREMNDSKDIYMINELSSKYMLVNERLSVYKYCINLVKNLE